MPNTFEVDYNEAQGLALGLGHVIEEENASVGLGIAAMLILIGRLMSQGPLEAEEEIKFVQDLTELIGVYFAGEAH